MPKCGVCEGSKKQTLRGEEITTEGRKKIETAIDCVWCHGSGEMTEIQLEGLQQYKDLWCKCGNPSGEGGQRGSYFVGDGDHPKLYKHHWRCADCDKVLQIG